MGLRLQRQSGLHRLLLSRERKHDLALALAFAGAISMSACQTSQQTTGTLAGGAIGASSGALIGSAVSGGSTGGAIAGGAIGAGTGGLDQQRRDATSLLDDGSIAGIVRSVRRWPIGVNGKLTVVS
jgi:hypothetical protein